MHFLSPDEIKTDLISTSNGMPDISIDDSVDFGDS